MFDKNDYTKWTIEALVAEEKKIKKNEIYLAGFIGFLVGVIIFGIVKNGLGLLYIAIPLFMIGLFFKHSQLQKQNLKLIKAEIDSKNTK